MALEKKPREHEPLPLAARQHPHRFEDVVAAEEHGPESVATVLVVVAKVGVLEILEGRPVNVGENFVLAEKTAFRRRAPFHRAGQWRHLAENRREQRRLAAPVRTDDADRFARRQFQLQPFEQRLSGKADGDVVEIKNLVAEAPAQFEVEGGETGQGRRFVDGVEFGEALQPGLGLPRPGAGAPLIDERLFPAHEVALFHEFAPLGLPPFLPELPGIAVIPRINEQAAALEFPRFGGDVVQELPVVGNYHRRRRAVSEEAF